MKKQDWYNIVIEVHNKEHGRKVKLFWLKVFPDNDTIEGWTFCDIGEYRYYGTVNDRINNYIKDKDSCWDIKDANILTLEQAEAIWAKEHQPELTFPREMIVSDFEDFRTSHRELVYGIFPERNSDCKVISHNNLWRHAKELPKQPEIFEISIDVAKEELAKLHNCTIEQIKIIID